MSHRNSNGRKFEFGGSSRTDQWRRGFGDRATAEATDGGMGKVQRRRATAADIGAVPSSLQDSQCHSNKGKISSYFSSKTAASSYQTCGHNGLLVTSSDKHVCDEDNESKVKSTISCPAKTSNDLVHNTKTSTTEVLATGARSSKKETLKLTSRQVVSNRKKLTDYFPVRRSERETRSRLLKKRQREVEEAVLSGHEDGLRVECILGKGRGVITTKPFKKGEFVVEYSGELIALSQAIQRESIYAQDENTGCYMYYFLHNGVRYCVDATAETGKLGRLINHSRHSGNLVTKTFIVNGMPHLILVAKRDIEQGEELLYDYGDRSKMSLASHPWLAT